MRPGIRFVVGAHRLLRRGGGVAFGTLVHHGCPPAAASMARMSLSRYLSIRWLNLIALSFPSRSRRFKVSTQHRQRRLNFCREISCSELSYGRWGMPQNARKCLQDKGEERLRNPPRNNQGRFGALPPTSIRVGALRHGTFRVDFFAAAHSYEKGTGELLGSRLCHAGRLTLV